MGTPNTESMIAITLSAIAIVGGLIVWFLVWHFVLSRRE